MKFNLPEKRPKKYIGKFSPWFAWYPVMLSGTRTIVWLQWVECRRVDVYPDITYHIYVLKEDAV